MDRSLKQKNRSLALNNGVVLEETQIKYLLPVLIVLSGVAIRFFKISALSIWTDEGISVSLAKSGLSNIIASAAADVHPPLYYLLLKCWIFAFGSGEIAVRSLSAVCGSVSLLLIYLIAKSIFGNRVAILATFISAISPFLVWYSQETRAYSLLLMLTLTSTYFLITYLKLGRRMLVPYFVVTAAALYTHYYAIWIVFVHGAYVLANRQHYSTRIKGWLLSQTALLLAFLPWLFVAAKQFAQGQEGRDFSILSIPKAYVLLVIGRSIDLLRVGKVINAEHGSRIVDGTVIVLAALLIIYLLIRAFLAIKRSRNPIETLPVLYAVLPLLLIGGLSLIRPIFDSKSLIIIFPALAMLASLGILSHGKRAAFTITALVIALFSFSLINYYANPYPWKEDFRSLAKHLEANVQKDEVVLLQPGYLDSALIYYYDEDSIIKRGPGLNPSRDDIAAGINGGVTDFKGVWLVLSAHPEADPDRHTESLLRQKYIQANENSFSGFNVIHYRDR